MDGLSARALEALAAAEISCSKSESEQWAKVLNMSRFIKLKHDEQKSFGIVKADIGSASAHGAIKLIGGGSKQRQQRAVHLRLVESRVEFKTLE